MYETALASGLRAHCLNRALQMLLQEVYSNDIDPQPRARDVPSDEGCWEYEQWTMPQSSDCSPIIPGHRQPGT